VLITLNNHLRRPNINARTPRSIIMSQSSSSAPSSTAPSSIARSSHYAKGISDSQSTVSSGLSSVPSHLFTPTVGSNPAEPEKDESQDPRVADIFVGKRKARTSIIWNPENWREVEIAGQRRWRCNRCESSMFQPSPGNFISFSTLTWTRPRKKQPLTVRCVRLKILSSPSLRCTESGPTALLTLPRHQSINKRLKRRSEPSSHGWNLTPISFSSI
jgi:hypothetical protein